MAAFLAMKMPYGVFAISMCSMFDSGRKKNA
jgi:hypothetical protein